MKFGASLNTIVHGSSFVLPSYKGSLTTLESLVITDTALVVGIFKWFIASLHKNSRMDERRTARPSASQEYGVLPAPFNCSSHLCALSFKIVPNVIALPSPNCPANFPN